MSLLNFNNLNPEACISQSNNYSQMKNSRDLIFCIDTILSLNKVYQKSYDISREREGDFDMKYKNIC